ncbi:hypothetical protein OROMI_010360 [Orobanche minor]
MALPATGFQIAPAIFAILAIAPIAIAPNSGAISFSAFQPVLLKCGRLRKHLEKLRPPTITELLLSNDGERILEGCLTNFFVVCLKQKHDLENLSCIEVQTAPVSDGVLPGVLRQVIKDICLKIGIPFREVAPSWSERELWTEAFITNSLRILQHVETIKSPDSWESIESKTWEEITWVEKRFEDGPGRITSMLQKEVLRYSDIEAFSVTSFFEERRTTV